MEPKVARVRWEDDLSYGFLWGTWDSFATAKLDVEETKRPNDIKSGRWGGKLPLLSVAAFSLGSPLQPQ